MVFYVQRFLVLMLRFCFSMRDFFFCFCSVFVVFVSASSCASMRSHKGIDCCSGSKYHGGTPPASRRATCQKEHQKKDAPDIELVWM